MKWNRITREEAISTLGVNAKPHFFKRVVAGLIDMVIMFFFHYAIYSLVLITPIANTMNNYYQNALLAAEVLKVEANYAEKQVVESDYSGDYLLHYDYTENQYYIVVDIDFGEDATAKEEAYNTYKELLQTNDYYNDLVFKYHLHNYLITAFLCGGLTEIIFLLIVPLIKNCGQTLGMLVMSFRMYNAKYVGKPKWYQYVGRFFFTFFVISAIPYLFMAEWTIIVVPIVTLIIMSFNKNNRALKDFVSGISFVEKKTFVDVDEEEPEMAEDKKEDKTPIE